MTTVHFKYGMFDEVFIIHDPMKLKRIVTSMSVRGNNHTYELTLGTECSFHLAEEIDFFKEENKKSAGF